MVNLWLNAYYGDSSARIVIYGKWVAEAAERFRRMKHWAEWPRKK